MTWNDAPIEVEHVFPPIPIRSDDYCAYLDGHEEHPRWRGYGATAGHAVAELLTVLYDECLTASLAATNGAGQ